MASVGLICVLVGAVPRRTFAQESARLSTEAASTPAQPPEVVKIAGVVQYVEGRAVKTESGVQSEIVYQSSIYENDRIEAVRGTAIKIAARNGCKIILRGEGAAAASTDKKPWRFRGESVRAICLGGSGPGQVIAVANVAFTITDGEVLILTEKATAPAMPSVRALVLNGRVQVRGQTLEPHKLYSVESTAVNQVSPAVSEEELRQLNLRNVPPRESKEWPTPPTPPNPPTVRLIFGPTPTGGQVSYDNDNLNQKDLAGVGPRVQLHLRKTNDTSFIFALTAMELQDKSQNGYSYQAEGVANRSNTVLVEAGHRFHHDRWWSPFYRFGVGYNTSEITLRKSSNYSQYKYEFYVASASYGIDAHLIPKFLGGFGVYGSAEAMIIQSLWRGARENRSGPNGSGAYPPVIEPWRLTQLSAVLGLGIEYEF